MVNLYLLDRNAISDIKRHLEQKDIKPERLEKLKGIDYPENFISSVLSIWEGENAKKENIKEKKEVIKKEINALSKFYKIARTDKSINAGLAKVEKSAKLFSTEREELWEQYNKLIEWVLESEIYQPLAKKEQKNIKINY